MIHIPTEQTLFDLVASTHAADRIPLTIQEIQETWAKKKVSPYARGHFLAYMYILHNLSNSIDFPAKDPNMITDIQKSSMALSWLRELHTRFVEPLVNSPLLEGDINGPQRYHLGNYRMFQTQAITRPAPPSNLLPAIMHNWLKDIAIYHHSIKDKVLNPFAFSANDAHELIQRVKDIQLFFSVVQPFAYGNQRLGRIVELAFRWKWNVPIVHYWPSSKEYNKLLIDLGEYEKRLPDIIQRAVPVK